MTCVEKTARHDGVYYFSYSLGKGFKQTWRSQNSTDNTV